jgi:thiamine-phosphate pyrophosphorylase
MTDAFGLYLVLTSPVAGYDACMAAAVERGVRYVQLRMKDARREDVISVGKRLADIARGSTTKLIINDDVEVARAVDADGLHVGQSDMSIEIARQLWPASQRKVFGLSTHDEVQATRAEVLSPDYIGVGPIFPTPTKRIPDPVLGIERAAAIVRRAHRPCVAIGGLDADNLTAVLEAGISNFAVVRYVCTHPRPAEPIAALVACWRERYAQRPPCSQ